MSYCICGAGGAPHSCQPVMHRSMGGLRGYGLGAAPTEISYAEFEAAAGQLYWTLKQAVEDLEAKGDAENKPTVEVLKGFLAPNGGFEKGVLKAKDGRLAPNFLTQVSKLIAFVQQEIPSSKVWTTVNTVLASVKALAQRYADFAAWVATQGGRVVGSGAKGALDASGIDPLKGATAATDLVTSLAVLGVVVGGLMILSKKR